MYSIITSSLKVYSQVRKNTISLFSQYALDFATTNMKYRTNFFYPAESESAHDRLPPVHDPMLVHDAQLDILKLQNHATENIQSRVQQIVHAFDIIEKDLKASLRADSCRNAIREYKTSTKSRMWVKNT